MLAGPDERPFHQERRQHHPAGNAVGCAGESRRSPRHNTDNRRARRSCRRTHLAENGRSGSRGSRSGGSCNRGPASARPPASRPARQTRGKCSHIEIPGTAVAIGLNSPRIPSGASGFMSNESRWLKPAGQENQDHRLRPRLRALALPRPFASRRHGPWPPAGPTNRAPEPRETHLDELAANKSNRMPVRCFHSVFQLRQTSRGIQAQWQELFNLNFNTKRESSTKPNYPPLLKYREPRYRPVHGLLSICPKRSPPPTLVHFTGTTAMRTISGAPWPRSAAHCLTAAATSGSRTATKLFSG